MSTKINSPPLPTIQKSKKPSYLGNRSFSSEAHTTNQLPKKFQLPSFPDTQNFDDSHTICDDGQVLHQKIIRKNSGLSCHNQHTINAEYNDEKATCIVNQVIIENQLNKDRGSGPRYNASEEVSEGTLDVYRSELGIHGDFGSRSILTHLSDGNEDDTDTMINNESNSLRSSFSNLNMSDLLVKKQNCQLPSKINREKSVLGTFKKFTKTAAKKSENSCINPRKVTVFRQSSASADGFKHRSSAKSYNSSKTASSAAPFCEESCLKNRSIQPHRPISISYSSSSRTYSRNRGEHVYPSRSNSVSWKGKIEREKEHKSLKTKLDRRKTIDYFDRKTNHNQSLRLDNPFNCQKVITVSEHIPKRPNNNSIKVSSDSNKSVLCLPFKSRRSVKRETCGSTKKKVGRSISYGGNK